MRHTQLSGILRRKQITIYQPEDISSDNGQQQQKQKKVKLPHSGFCRHSRPLWENQRKLKERQYLDLNREMQSNIRITIIAIITAALERSPKAWKRGWKSWKSKHKRRQSKLLHC